MNITQKLLIISLMCLDAIPAYAADLDLDRELMYYSRFGDATKIKELIDRGANVNPDPRLMPPLAEALGNKKFDAAQVLITAGADLTNSKTLSSAVLAGIESVKFLLAARDASNSNDAYECAHNLIIALGYGRNDALDLFLNRCADVNKPDEYGTPPLIYARKEAQILRLLEAGADINAVNRKGDTALYRAIQQGNEEAVTTLLSRPDIQVHKRDLNAALKLVEEAVLKDQFLLKTKPMLPKHEEIVRMIQGHRPLLDETVHCAAHGPKIEDVD